MTQAYPLHWPAGWPRTPADKRGRACFETGFGKARDGLLKEVALMGGRLPVLSSNVELRRDGLPYANGKAPADPGVAIYFTRRDADGEDRQVAIAEARRIKG